MILEKLAKKKLIHPPDWLINNICFLTISGSRSYACHTENSDWDYAGIAFPRREMVFPHTIGIIPGFGTQANKFKQFHASHIKDTDSNREYDIVIHGIVEFFELARQGNANILDIIFTSQVNIVHSTQAGNLIRENRKLFLSKQALARFRSYAYSMVKKAKTAQDDIYVSDFTKYEDSIKVPHTTSFEDAKTEGQQRGSIHKLSHLSNQELVDYIHRYKENMDFSTRFEDRKIKGMDSKFLYNLVRLLNQCEQILTKHDMDLEENKEQHKAIRRGEWTIGQIIQHFNDKERQLEELHSRSTLRDICDEKQIKKVLMECLEIHYGDLSKCLSVPDEKNQILNEIAQIIDKARSKKLI